MSKIAQPSVGVVILTYNAEDYILSCLKSVFANTYHNFSITIVDNHSSDTTVAVIKKHFPKIHIIQNKTNIGYGAGNNIGIQAYRKNKTDYILLLNPDTIVKPSLIRECVEAFAEDERIGVVGPMITYLHDKHKIWFAGGYYNPLFCYTRHPFMNSYILTKHTLVSGIPDRERKSFTKKEGKEELVSGDTGRTVPQSGTTDFITGACMMIRTAILTKTGLLPEKYFLYFEDTAFCQTVMEHGFSCYFFTRPLVYHNVSSASGLAGSNYLTPLKAYYFARNNFLYIRQHVPWYRKLSAIIGQFCIRFPYYSLHLLRNKNYAGFTWYIQGMMDGLRGKTGKPSIFNHL